ncbi:aminoglycoside phosphotransferase family protein, partial [Rhizobium johnstonii]
ADAPADITDDFLVSGYFNGRVCEDLSDQFVGSERMMLSAARLLRDFHLASKGFMESDREVQTWMLSTQEPREIICHGDYAPYNVAT